MHQKFSIKDLDLIGRLYVVRAFTIRQIATHMNSSPYFIRNALKDLGIDISELLSKRGPARKKFLKQRYPDYFKGRQVKTKIHAPIQQDMFNPVDETAQFLAQEKINLPELKFLLNRNPESPRRYRIGVREAFTCLLQAMRTKLTPRKGVYD